MLSIFYAILIQIFSVNDKYTNLIYLSIHKKEIKNQFIQDVPNMRVFPFVSLLFSTQNKNLKRSSGVLLKTIWSTTVFFYALISICATLILTFNYRKIRWYLYALQWILIITPTVNNILEQVVYNFSYMYFLQVTFIWFNDYLLHYFIMQMS